MSETATCPKCGFERAPGATECPACGIIYARFDPERATHRRLAAAQSAPGEQLFDPTQPTAGLDPYRVPSAALTAAAAMPATELARRFSRLAAAILDSLIYIAVAFVGFGPILVLGDPATRSSDGTLELILMVVMLGGLGAVFVVNLYYLHRDGQTLGKKALHIRIVRLNDDQASLGRLFGLRMLVPGFIGAVPIVGPFFSLADALFIFGEARRCIHDYIADTKVVVA